MPHRPVPSGSASLFIVLLAMALVACGPAAGGSASSPTSVDPSVTLPSESAGGSPITEPSASPSDDLGNFTCELPIESEGTIPRAQITDVRVGTHAGYDRIVVEFEDGVPPYILQMATPPLLSDPAGMEMEVAGASFLNLVLMGGTRVTEDGELSYGGRTEFRPRDFPVLAELVESGDFEATSAWYIGLQQESCVRVVLLTDPSRLVIDIQQP
jgi:hypothetical protein